ncbi:hypothetical protein B7P43_G16336 [Cryptotermes secundus]|uniref:non-specific serine/threonine protein kinase n=1 Tax=Cryptotermes secundus TaxID=105785 RepID=A0A2J7QIK3_9NEOP|nr:hypothetical protein B7P43_G16336 [Cryptotermes secundus]
MKAIDLGKHSGAQSSVHKEVFIHRMLNRPNIVRFYGHRQEGPLEYIFLEFVSGGDLFDRIAEPDRGITNPAGQRYFNEILSGVEYLHSRGIVHRDLKPENILLDEHDNLNICDFGLATIFRGKGMERTLTECCGTFAYMAPEVLMPPYHGEPADIWSCGIILVFLLTGGLPWKVASMECNEYVASKDGKAGHLESFVELDHLAMDLIQKILCTHPISPCKIKGN